MAGWLAGKFSIDGELKVKENEGGCDGVTDRTEGKQRGGEEEGREGWEEEDGGRREKV